MISDRALFRSAGIVAGAVLVLLLFDAWRTSRELARRAGQGSPIVTTTGIRG